MYGGLLQTKLYVPRVRPFLVPRPHLIKKLNQGLQGKLTLISAPAGFGKTTLVSEWLSQLTIDNWQLSCLLPISLFFNKIPSGCYILQSLPTTPNNSNTRFSIVFASEKTTKLPDPTDSFMNCRQFYGQS